MQGIKSHNSAENLSLVKYHHKTPTLTIER